MEEITSKLRSQGLSGVFIPDKLQSFCHVEKDMVL